MILAGNQKDAYLQNMVNFILTLAIAFCLLLGSSLLVSYCKRRQARTSHGLTGMCHESGGRMCGGCGAKLLTEADRATASCAAKSR
jgi:hypothetical protein